MIRRSLLFRVAFFPALGIYGCALQLRNLLADVDR